MEISVIVANYNQALFINQCLSSLISQSFTKPYEIIVVDDCSTDQSILILKAISYESKLKTVFHHKNEGQSIARNLGMSIATGKYICFVDSDDYVSPNFLSVLWDKIESTKSEIAYCEHFILNGVISERCRNSNKSLFGCADTVTSIELLELLSSGRASAVVWDKIYSRKVIQDAGLFFAQNLINEDIPFNARFLTSCDTVGVVFEPLYYYRQNPNSTTKKFSQKIFDDMLKVQTLFNEILQASSINKKKQTQLMSEFTTYYLCWVGLYRLKLLNSLNLSTILKLVVARSEGVNISVYWQAKTHGN